MKKISSKLEFLMFAGLLFCGVSHANSGKDPYIPTKGDWLVVQLKLQNPAQATLEVQGCQISYIWKYPNVIQVNLMHFKEYKANACDLNLQIATSFVRQVAESFGWKWVKVEEKIVLVSQ